MVTKTNTTRSGQPRCWHTRGASQIRDRGARAVCAAMCVLASTASCGAAASAQFVTSDDRAGSSEDPSGAFDAQEAHRSGSEIPADERSNLCGSGVCDTGESCETCPEDCNPCHRADATLFPSTSLWYQDRSRSPKHPDSDRVIGWMSQAGKSFGVGGQFRIDLGLTVLNSDIDTPMRSFVKSGGFYEGECDYGSIPVPLKGSIEGESDYACNGGGDCHLLVVHRSAGLLYEMWTANIAGGGADGTPFYGGCMAVWDLRKSYGWDAVAGLDYDRMGRGTDCTSADAAGYPIAPLTFDADELEAGEIKHALRFVLPNANIRRLSYVAPATHATPATTGPANAPPYGAHMRLKPTTELVRAHPDVDFNKLPKGAIVIIKALQTYGMFLSDGGNVALTGQADTYTRAKYYNRLQYAYGDEDPNRLLHEHDLQFLRITDFDMLDNGGPERTWGETGCQLLYDYDDSYPRVSPR